MAGAAQDTGNTLAEEAFDAAQALRGISLQAESYASEPTFSAKARNWFMLLADVTGKLSGDLEAAAEFASTAK